MDLRDTFSEWSNQSQVGEERFTNDDLELAYLLQHGEPGDRHIQYQLVERFAAEIFRMVDGWSALVRGTSSSTSEVNALVSDILATALSQIDRFREEENVRNWIYRLAVKRLLKVRRWRLPTLKRDKKGGEGIPARFIPLTRQERVTLWLRYGLGLNLLDCEKVFGQSQLKRREVLKQARLKLLSEESLECVEANQDFFQNLWDLSDRVLDETPETASEVEKHLRENLDYQRLLDVNSVFEQTLSNELGIRWPLPEVDAATIQALNRGIVDCREKHRLPILAPRWVKAGWTAFFILAFIATGLFSMDEAGNEQEQALQPTPVARNLPDVIPGGLISDLVFQDSTDQLRVQFSAPAQSDDGHWLVYTVYEIQDGEIDSEKVDTTYQANVFLFQIATETTQPIYVSQPVPFREGMLWLNPPAISADGSWITFAAPSMMSNVDAGGCSTESGIPCLDIYTYNRNSGETTILTQSWNGSPTDGISYAPAISGDGRIITFWSSASNLIEGQMVECDGQDLPGKCTFGYIFSRQTREITSLPVQGVPEATSLQPMSLSADGHLVAFTTSTADASTGLPGYQSYLYNSADGTIEDVNQAFDGAPGNGSVFTVALDASGRYVAFASDSTNLVPNDTNGYCDVFWRDLQSGTLIKVSMGIDGEQTNADSGILASDIGLSSLDLSPDGQQVVFLSLADNLVEDSVACDPTAQELCNNLYYYDLQTRTTELIAPQRSNGYDFFPMISGDGRWISYAGMRYDYPHSLYCADILRHDRQRGWTYNLTGSGSVIPGYSWFWAGSMNLPGVETNAMAYSQDGAFLATANSDGKVRIFQMGDQSEYAAMETGGSSSVISLDISPDNLWLAGGTAAGEFRVWKLDQKRLYFDLDDLPGRVIDIFFSEDNSHVIVATPVEVSIWRLGAEVITRVRKIPLDGVRVLDTDLSPAGNLLASARQDGSVWLVLLSNGLTLSRLYGGEAAIYDVLFSPDGTRLTSRSVDGTINVWEISWLGFGALNVQFLDSYKYPDWIGNLGYMANNSTLATILTEGGIGFWDIDSRQTYKISSHQVERLVFAPQGDTLATASYGSIDLWNGPGLTEGKYFNHTESNTFPDSGFASITDIIDLRASQWLSTQWSGRDLYEAAEQLTFDLFAPAHIPEGIIFQGAYLTGLNGVLLHYSFYAGTGKPAVLYIQEQLVDDELPTMWVGDRAEVRESTLKGVLVEFVSGDWLPKVSSGANSNEPLWIWDGDSPSIRMRWLVNDLLFAMYYHAPDDSSIVLSLEDMLQIASGFLRVSQPPGEETKYVEYMVQPGDTCTWIADTYGVDIGTIMQANHLGESCDIIFVGQKLVIPITYLNVTQDEVDFNCDGTVERVDVTMMSAFWSGVHVMVKNDAGFYVQAWEWMIEEPIINRLESIRVLESGDCNSLLALEMVNDYQSSWMVFSWDGATMQPYEIDPLELELLLKP